MEEAELCHKIRIFACWKIVNRRYSFKYKKKSVADENTSLNKVFLLVKQKGSE